ncbi:exo-poly-alpha-D-galacturonosidase [Neptunitalea chrysea]|uniref:Exo-poly-alpha-D-galacturonosidase n=1 Tax=Neptunitalea chrysea TaxID=1647581 RepID=A0A9W6B2N1_9FLAO|nr:glycoside hydrolase family 28 protein [Neptunitalea chrysea]GLB51243.1 exo-poly-alpha-D-galacturonosidase [Neptunitalea chrysea]
MKLKLVILFVCSSLAISLAKASTCTVFYNVKDYGAYGNGIYLDTDAINKVIETAAKNGGGTVVFPAGNYLCFSIHLKSYVTLHLESGATIIAANMKEHDGQYDDPEANLWGDEFQYQDFGHSHFRNSLIWGENLTNIGITGSGRIYGKGLERWGKREHGLANKTISLKLCKNVCLRDFSILHGGHFGILATGVNNLTIDNVTIDTNRDAIDIDGCRFVHISNCSLNSPNDDALVLKSSYALGYPLATENITITNCAVYGFDEGTFLDGTYQTTQKQAPDKGVVTGRIKLGTESNGSFKNITISNCTFEHCRGLALETVDGATLEDITISNIIMKDILNAPLFFRLGSRMRGPNDLQMGTFKRILINNVSITCNSTEHSSMLMGISNHYVEDIMLSNIWISMKGNGTKQMAKIKVPELEEGYPDPQEFGTMPASGFYIRHAKNISMDNIHITYEHPDERPIFYIEDVSNISLDNIYLPISTKENQFVLKNVQKFSNYRVTNLKDSYLENISITKF